MLRNRKRPLLWVLIKLAGNRLFTMTEKTRGALIVIEGCDRAGKSTQCGLLEKNLGIDHTVKLLKYPDRTTKIGKMINNYLSCSQDVDDHVIHLLFSANRWEQKSMMLDLLKSGTTLLVDRYAYSGVCYTAAKQGFDLEWCKQPDIGLPCPDAVLYLTLSSEAAAKRGGFGEERYEKAEFQKKVNENFTKMQDDNWKVIDADSSIDDLQCKLQNICKQIIEDSKDKSIGKLWMDGNYD